MSTRLVLALPLLAAALCAVAPNETQSDAISVKQSLDRLAVTGSVLMIAAHPDDENTGLLAYLARGRKVRTAYLSLTRGEGGQNGIGSEQGAELGVIRTQELLQSRRVDWAEQYFTRAIDFGFSKSPKEAIEMWGHDAVLADIVWVIRKFRPDVVILQFTGTPRDGHGHHQASAILGKEAYDAAGDPARFPEQLKYVQPWHPVRLMGNRRGFTPAMQKEIDALPDKLDLEIGGYDPLLGYSYGELAGISRSMNHTQTEGTPRQRGEVKATLVTLQGTKATKDLFDGIDLTWNRYPGGKQVADLLGKAAAQWKPEHPEGAIEALSAARQAAVNITVPEAAAKVKQMDEAIAKCAGLWLDFAADRQDVVAGESFKFGVVAIQRTDLPVTLKSLAVNGEALKDGHVPIKLKKDETKTISVERKLDAPPYFTQPYWLREPAVHDEYAVADKQLIGRAQDAPPLTLKAEVQIGAITVTLERPILYRFLDRLQGESITPVTYVPPVAVRFVQPTIVFPNDRARKVEVELKSFTAGAKGTVSLKTSGGWIASPSSREFAFERAGESGVLSFEVSPDKGATSADLRADVTTGGNTINVGVRRIDYPHIPLQTLFPPAKALVVRADAVTLAKRVGYVMGAGDEVPEALTQLGCSVTLLSAADLAMGDLSQYDAIITGVRAYPERQDLVANQDRLLEYVHNGGTMIVQYVRLERGGQPLSHLGPYPFETGNLRVTQEDAPVEFQSKDILLSTPNQITQADFKGWVQERGLYFAAKWDPRYEAPFQTQDTGETPLKGATLVTRYGKGVYIFTAFSWFRELPAGVPGAYRIFANFLSASKTMGAK